MTAAMISNLPGCHTCGVTPMFQWTRLATPKEAEAQRQEITVLQGGRELSDEEIAQRYGPLRTAVTGCGLHSFDTKDDYRPGLRAILHAADCAGHGSCACPDPLDPQGAQ
jgi:hypothetical protein